MRVTYQRALPVDIRRGKNAYLRYNRLLAHLSGRIGFTITVGAGVFAALSPNNDYLGNLRDVRTLLRAHRQGRSATDIKVSSYHPNKLKAWSIASGDHPLDVLGGQKVRSFFCNIMDPTNPVPVTVDGHVLNIWRGERKRLSGNRMQHELYETIAHEVRRVAAEVELVPCEFQGVIWHAWRRIHRIQTDDQLRFWEPDEYICEVVS